MEATIADTYGRPRPLAWRGAIVQLDVLIGWCREQGAEDIVIGCLTSVRSTLAALIDQGAA